MKKILLLVYFVVVALTVKAQNNKNIQSNGFDDSLRWCVGFNLFGGVSSYNLKTANTTKHYQNALNANISRTVKLENGISSAFEVNLGFFFGTKRHFGIGTGLSYLRQSGDLILDSFHVEYESRDFQGRIFRQIITAKEPIRELVKSITFNIPLVFKYKHAITNKIAIALDAGLLINLGLRNEYSTKASFDYEAIYQYTQDQNGNYVAVYDNSPTPSITNDWYITQAQYLASNPGGMVHAFDSLSDQGYNVGLAVRPHQKSGIVNYSKISIGFVIHPQFNFRLGNKLIFNIGPYFIYQPYKNSVINEYKLTDKSGSYYSVLNSVVSGVNQCCGVSLGLGFIF